VGRGTGNGSITAEMTFLIELNGEGRKETDRNETSIYCSIDQSHTIIEHDLTEGNRALKEGPSGEENEGGSAIAGSNQGTIRRRRGKDDLNREKCRKSPGEGGGMGLRLLENLSSE